jgi:ABC-type nitrate/sulfonate/bicarbonate transport system substrate-binding protein
VVIKIADNTTTPNNWELVRRLTGRDLLKEAGVNVKFIPGISGTGPRFQPLLEGLLDVEGGTWVGWVNVIARGGHIRAVYANSAITSETEKINRSGLLVLSDSPIHSVKDLKGRTIAVNTLGLDAEYTVKLLLEKNGLSLKDVQLLVVPIPNEEQVLRTHQADAIGGTTTGGNWFDLALSRGGVRILPGSSHYDAEPLDATIYGAGFREDFIRNHPETVRRYVKAFEDSKHIIWDAYRKDPGKVQKVYSEIASEIGGNPDLGKYFKPIPPEASVIRDADVQFWIDMLVKEGAIKPGQIKPSDIYTNEFNPYAHKNSTLLGKK